MKKKGEAQAARRRHVNAARLHAAIKEADTVGEAWVTTVIREENLHGIWPRGFVKTGLYRCKLLAMSAWCGPGDFRPLVVAGRGRTKVCSFGWRKGSLAQPTWGMSNRVKFLAVVDEVHPREAEEETP